ncbi:PfkB family carbohydrate kinase [Arthrobacter globiformis]|uniref:PfkB family carbohydrate kinase n=1 Tax=Arthrobacter globiformis TaxID=1665 RepID=UPI0027940143|nr:PfkB family carbohydrate kinase [Arthrobacter globiformis]MDQ0620519.1 ribokinase [Arthrobacter globiformis]
MRSTSICVVGSLNADLIAYVGADGSAASYATGSKFEMAAGGKSLNAAMSIASLDPTVTLVGRIGSDDLGNFIAGALSTRGVTTEGLIRDDAIHTGVGHVRVNPEGEYDTVVVPGANGNFSADDVDAYLDSHEPPAFVVLNLEVPLPAVRQAATRFRERGATVVLNLSPVNAEARALLRLADVVVMNRSEACHILDVPPTTGERLLLTALREAGARTPVLTLGDGGVVALNGNDLVKEEVEPTRVVNSVGAGDSFLAMMVLAMANDHPFPVCLRAANEAGRLVCGRSESFLTSADVRHIEDVIGVPLAKAAATYPRASEIIHG